MNNLTEKPIRILQIVGTMNAGGLENFIMNVYRKVDKTQIQFDFLVHRKSKCFFEDEIESLGGKVFHFSLSEDRNILKYKNEIHSFFLAHPEYKIIHCHKRCFSFFYMQEAKRTTHPFIISHSHNAGLQRGEIPTIGDIINWSLSLPEKRWANARFACGIEAGKSLFKNCPFTTVYSAIDPKPFIFSPKNREEIRAYYGIPENAIVFGNIGRFHRQKNQIFLLKCFKKVCQTKECFLFVIGNGKRKNKLEHYIKKNKLEKKVFLINYPKDVIPFYSAFDLFVLPSLYEGFPLTAVEAQAEGLPIFCSTNVTSETKVQDNPVLFLPLKKKTWIKHMLAFQPEKTNRANANNIIVGSSFDISTTTTFLEKFYLDTYKTIEKKENVHGNSN